VSSASLLFLIFYLWNGARSIKAAA
jgi:hypothetical protein